MDYFEHSKFALETGLQLLERGRKFVPYNTRYVGFFRYGEKIVVDGIELNHNNTTLEKEFCFGLDADGYPQWLYVNKVSNGKKEIKIARTDGRNERDSLIWRILEN